MAKFIYEMQNILDIKYKLEEQAKQEYMSVQARLNDAVLTLDRLEERKNSYMDQYMSMVSDRLDVLEIENCKNSIIIMDEYIARQQTVIDKIQKELDLAVLKLNEAMKERKIHEKLRENQFEKFKKELNLEEMKEIDELVSYRYNSLEPEDE